MWLICVVVRRWIQYIIYIYIHIYIYICAYIRILGDRHQFMNTDWYSHWKDSHGPMAHARGGDGDRSKTVSIQGTSAILWSSWKFRLHKVFFFQNGKITKVHKRPSTDWQTGEFASPKSYLFFSSEAACVLMCTLQLGLRSLQCEPGKLYGWGWMFKIEVHWKISLGNWSSNSSVLFPTLKFALHSPLPRFSLVVSKNLGWAVSYPRWKRPATSKSWGPGIYKDPKRVVSKKQDPVFRDHQKVCVCVCLRPRTLGGFRGFQHSPHVPFELLTWKLLI